MVPLLAVFLLAALACSALSMTAAFRYLAEPRRKCVGYAPVSILKPLAGLDDGLESNLRTFFEQDYPRYEILFAVGDVEDPAVAVVEKVQREYPHIPSHLVITGEPLWANAKLYSLEAMLKVAAHDLVVMSDSDTRVGSEFLKSVAAEFEDSHVGLATCPYRAVPGSSIWSRLEATNMNTDFMAGILSARFMEGMQFAVGPTIVVRRAVLAAIGGCERLKDYLAEDFVMGKFAAEAGYGVILSSCVVEHHIGNTGLRGNAAHRLRWVRSTRRSRPAGYVGQLFTMPLPIMLIVWALAPGLWPAAIVTILGRILAAWTISKRVLHVALDWKLLAVEDLIGFAFWIAGFFGKTITWRGRRYRLLADGRFELTTDVVLPVLAPTSSLK